MSEQSEDAWIASEWVKGRSQTDIAAELGISSSVICNRIVRFCASLGRPVQFSRYGDQRVAAAREALRRHDGELTRPAKYDGDLAFLHARMEHAWLLRAEGLTFQQISDHLGVSCARAHQIVSKFARRVTRATRKTRFEIQQSATV